MDKPLDCVGIDPAKSESGKGEFRAYETVSRNTTLCQPESLTFKTSVEQLSHDAQNILQRLDLNHPGIARPITGGITCDVSTIREAARVIQAQGEEIGRLKQEAAKNDATRTDDRPIGIHQISVKIDAEEIARVIRENLPSTPDRLTTERPGNPLDGLTTDEALRLRCLELAVEQGSDLYALGYVEYVKTGRTAHDASQPTDSPDSQSAD